MPAWQAVPNLRIPAEDADHALPSREVADVADERLRPNGVVHDGARLEHRAPARLLDPPRQIGVLAEGTAEALIEPSELAVALGSAGAPVHLSQLDPPVDAELARWAVANCHLMRDRFTVADLAFFMGMWDAGAVAEVLS